MKTKVKKFSKKLLALFLAVLMALTCFSSVMTAFAASNDVNYLDDAAEYNDLGWLVLSDEQAATALLDYLDQILAENADTIDETVGSLINGLGVSVLKWDAGARAINLNAVVVNETIYVHLHSVDEILYTLESVGGVLSRRASLLGDAGNIQLGSTNGMRRSNTSSCDILRGLLGILQKNAADYNGKDVFGELLRGGFDLGTVGSLASLDVYGLIGNALGAKDGYESNLVYNVVQALLFNNTNWFTDEEKAAYLDGSKPFVYDDVLLEKLSTKLLQQINVEVTYPYGTTSSKDRYQEIQEAGGNKGVNGYDSKLMYTEDGNVYLFQYEGIDPLVLTKDDSLFDFGYRALKLAWNTVLKDTLGTLHVNSNVDRGHGANFDNVYYYWASENIDWVSDINSPDFANNYSRDNLEKWANSLQEDTSSASEEPAMIPVYEAYGAQSAAQFLDEYVKGTFTYDRDAKGDGSWDEIKSDQLFGKLRYSPLADFGFNMTTGPINLYFLQTGFTHLDEFFAKEYDKYDSMVAGFNDALVAAVKDIFIDSSVRTNVYGGATYPSLATTGNIAEINDASIKTIVNTLVGNALGVLQYTADSTDASILKAFYGANEPGAKLTEKNLESAMIPLLIACIGNVNLNGYPLSECIHPEDWDKCKDAEAVAFVALREYLSYILPNKDYNVLVSTDKKDGSYKASLEGTLLPMARDAVTYVMQGYVPVTKVDGTKWDVTTAAVDDDETLFQLLNSVIAYYGGEYEFKNSKVTADTGAMAVGALLGLCDNEGKSIIKNDGSTEIWNNIDAVANKLLPVLGTLQYGDTNQEGHFNSKDLIYNDVILGIFDIGKSEIHSSGLCGVSNFLYRLLTIVSASPIQSQPITFTVYDFVADLVNAMFGARYSGQPWKTVVPERSSEHPFDDLLQIGTLAGTDGKDVGTIQKAICNFVEFSGYGTNGTKTYPDSMLRGIMFGVQSICSFVPGLLPTLSDFDLKLATVSFATPSVVGASLGSSINDTITIKNNSYGVNTAYLNNGKIEQNGRYIMKITNISVTGTGTASVGSYSNDFLNPGDSITITTATTAVNNSSKTSQYKAVVTYDIYDNKDLSTPVYTGLTTTAYKYISGELGWADVVYDRAPRMNEDLETNRASDTKTVNGYTAYSSPVGRDMVLNYPKELVISAENLSEIDKYQFRVRNAKTIGINVDRHVDGWYCYDKTTVIDGKSGSPVEVNENNAIPVFDRETGDLINKQKIDILVYKVSGDGTVTYYDVNGSQIPASSEDEAWQRNGVNGYNLGYDSTVNDTLNGSDTSDIYLIRTRDHVAYTIDEAYSNNIIAAAYQNGLGIYEYVYLKTGSGLNYDTTLGQISMRGPVDGIYIAQGKITIGKNSAEYTTDLFKYDGETKIAAGTYPINLRAYTQSDTSYNLVTTKNGSCTLYVGSRSGDIEAKINEAQTFIANYRPTDFVEIDETIGDQQYTDAITLAEDAVYKALSVDSSPLTPTTALDFSDTSVLAPLTKTVTTEYGDLAYIPFTTSNVKSDTNQSGYEFPVDVLAAAYVGDGDTGVSGVYYYDENCTMPIYSNHVLTSKDVQDGKDPAGIDVIQGTGKDSEKWYIRNTPSYAREWDTTTYSTPWYKISTSSTGEKIQATDSEGNKLYEQIQFVYRNKDSQKVNSDFTWLAKFAESDYQLVENDGGSKDNRGLYSRAIDYLTYVTEEVLQQAVDPSISNSAFTDISLVRNGLNNNNFDIVTYNKMVSLAKTVEDQYTLDITYVDNKTQERKTDEDVPFSAFNSYINNSDITVDGVEKDADGNVISCSGAVVNSSMSSVQLEVYRDMFNTYLSSVVERGYQGNQLEKEIVCASGNDYSAMTAEVATEDANGSVTFTSTDAEVPFGAVDESGKLVNEGAVIYEDSLWNNYVNALANAVSLATKGNGDYAYKDSKNYESENKAQYTCQITDCYSADTNLQAAEIALETATQLNVAYNASGYVTVDGVQVDTQKPYAIAKGSTVTLAGVSNGTDKFNGFEEDYIYTSETEEGTVEYKLFADQATMTVTPIFESTAPTGFNVTASLVVATNNKGDTNNVGVSGEYTIVLKDAEGHEVASTVFNSTLDNNTFTIENVPNGTYTATITSLYSMERSDITVIVNNGDVVGGAIPIIACDFDRSGGVSGLDAVPVYSAKSYSSDNAYLDLDGSKGISSLDAAIVYACGAGAISMPAVTIQ